MSRSRFSIRQVFLAVAAVIAFLLLADFNNRWNEKQRLGLQYEQAQARLAELEATRTALEARIEHASSNSAVEAWAYEQGGLVRPGDFVIVPQPAPGGAPTPTPTPMPQTEPRAKWEIWWGLFFDEP
ncbi:MAG TPA: septum formation initiator family protein [Anaerolineales bacterium]|nr:septum formation initiator family protein [Anaerolineales bacterium]